MTVYDLEAEVRRLLAENQRLASDLEGARDALAASGRLLSDRGLEIAGLRARVDRLERARAEPALDAEGARIRAAVRAYRLAPTPDVCLWPGCRCAEPCVDPAPGPVCLGCGAPYASPDSDPRCASCVEAGWVARPIDAHVRVGDPGEPILASGVPRAPSRWVLRSDVRHPEHAAWLAQRDREDGRG